MPSLIAPLSLRLFALSLSLMLFACSARQPAQEYKPAVIKPGVQKKLGESALANSAKAQELQKKLSAALAEARLGGGRAGIYVQSLSEDLALFKHNGHQQFIPASNQKLFTTAAALSLLGPEHRYETAVYAAGQLKQGIINGDLVIKGSGDPTVGARSSLAVDAFRQLAREIKRQGVTGVTGDLVGDASLFERANFYPGWNPSDEMMPFSALPSALTQNENCVLVRVTPAAKPGQAPRVEVEPKSAYPRVENRAMTSGAKKIKNHLSITRSGESIIVSGDISSRSGPAENLLTLADPAQAFVSVFAEVLAEEGVSLKGKPRVSQEAYRTRGEMKQVAAWRSGAMREIVGATNKKSNNLYAEQLFKTLAVASKGQGSREAGAATLQDFMDSIGLGPNEMMITDGSGLSRMDRATPYSLVLALRYMYQSPFFKDYFDSLPVAGFDGTLQRRMRGSKAEANVRAKTGTLRGASSLSGYVTAKDGRIYAFSVLVNEAGPGEAKALQDEVCAILSDY